MAKQPKSINYKFMTMIVVMTVLFVLLFATLYLIHRRESLKLYNETCSQLGAEVNSIININQQFVKKVQSDYSNWDQLIYNLELNDLDLNWFDNNIGTLVEDYNFLNIIVCDSDSRIVYKKRSPLDLDYTFSFNQHIFDQLKIKNKHSYFDYIDSNLVQIFISPINNNNGDYIGNIDCYLVIVSSWMSSELLKLSDYSNSNIEIISEPSTCNGSCGNSHYQVSLLDKNGNPLSYLSFFRLNPIYNLYNRSSLYMFIVIALVLISFIIIIRLSINKCIFKPLRIIEKSLSKGEVEDFEEISSSSREFSHIANLLKNYFSQKEDLKIAKERAEYSDKLKSKFLSNISHEIRTPMNSIIGFTDLLRDDSLDHKQKLEYINIIQEGSKKLVNLLTDLINYSKIESGEDKVEESAVSINGVIENSAILHSMDAQKKGLRIDYYPLEDPIGNAIILTDVEKLYSIINNLIKNAIIFSNIGTIKISASLDQNNCVCFHIQDNGIGIEDQYQEKIFERFFQVDDKLSRHHYGIGLGLTIAKSNVEILGGKIWVESKKEEGSTFSFSIPLKLYNP